MTCGIISLAGTSFLIDVKKRSKEGILMKRLELNAVSRIEQKQRKTMRKSKKNWVIKAMVFSTIVGGGMVLANQSAQADEWHASTVESVKARVDENAKSFTFEEGDTFWALGQAVNIKPEVLMDLNGFSEGQQYTVPVGTVVTFDGSHVKVTDAAGTTVAEGNLDASTKIDETQTFAGQSTDTPTQAYTAEQSQTITEDNASQAAQAGTTTAPTSSNSATSTTASESTADTTKTSDKDLTAAKVNAKTAIAANKNLTNKEKSDSLAKVDDAKTVDQVKDVVKDTNTSTAPTKDTTTKTSTTPSDTKDTTTETSTTSAPTKDKTVYTDLESAYNKVATAIASKDDHSEATYNALIQKQADVKALLATKTATQAEVTTATKALQQALVDFTASKPETSTTTTTPTTDIDKGEETTKPTEETKPSTDTDTTTEPTTPEVTEPTTPDTSEEVTTPTTDPTTPSTDVDKGEETTDPTTPEVTDPTTDPGFNGSDPDGDGIYDIPSSGDGTDDFTHTEVDEALEAARAAALAEIEADVATNKYDGMFLSMATRQIKEAVAISQIDNIMAQVRSDAALLPA